MQGTHLDSLVFSQDLYCRNRPALGFSATNKEDAGLWQRRLRRKLVQLLGGFPQQKCALRPCVLKSKTFPGYRREEVIFESRDNLSVFAYFLVPAGFTPPGPVVICLPGHGRGCDEIVGIEEDGTQRAEYGGYQNDFALQCVGNGFAALAVEQLAFGRRRDETARKAGPGSSCQPASGAALLFGQTMIGWRVYDVIRAVDYLCTRQEVDPKRIACMGISGGGTITFFSAAIEKRIRAAVVSGYFNTFRDSIMSIPHCMDNYAPGILKYAETYDIAGLIAPRLFFCESGTKDSIFPVEATKLAFDKVKGIYRVFGEEDKLDMEIFEGEHSFHGVKAFPFLKRWL